MKIDLSNYNSRVICQVNVLFIFQVEFPIPIVACNLMIEYADFYDNLQATAETLQCPRCSASVPANPGVCGNCGENVFQCHKCR